MNQLHTHVMGHTHTHIDLYDIRCFVKSEIHGAEIILFLISTLQVNL